MVAVLAALKDPSDGVAAAGVAAGVVVGVVAGASAGTTATAVQAPLFNSNLSLQDAICEFPGQVHVTAAFAIASHAVHLAASELSSKPVLHMPTAELVAEVQVTEPAFAIAVQAVHLSPSLKNPALHVNAVAAVSSVHVYMALASGAAAAVHVVHAELSVFLKVPASQPQSPAVSEAPATHAGHTASAVSVLAVVAVRAVPAILLPQPTEVAQVSAVAETPSDASTPACLTLSAAQAETRLSELEVQV
jgi:hypothetical protein